ncbi:MAG: DNA replication/repair protein RecF [Myxococcota bacterium]|nr:DNA replication/repair protein RecF [Myxococcota bacterium]
MHSLRLESLLLTHFRNLAHIKCRPNPRFNIVSGHNGEGKTNLIEAIYYFGVLRSFRTSRKKALISTGHPEAHMQGIFSGATSGLKCDVTITGKTRKYRLDGKNISLDGEHFRRLPMVLFHPVTMALVQGGPEGRRRFMDRVLFQAVPLYPALYSDYIKALANRNTLLRTLPLDTLAISAYDDVIAGLSEQIVALRQRLIGHLRPHFETAFEEISARPRASVLYRPKIQGTKEDILREIQKKRRVDEARGFTSLGPHADELCLAINGQAARQFASQGQQRMIALALKAAETQVLATETKQIPILLLDDVSSELDRERNKALFGLLNQMGGQVFITTTHLDYIKIDDERTDFHLDNGTLHTS